MRYKPRIAGFAPAIAIVIAVAGVVTLAVPAFATPIANGTNLDFNGGVNPIGATNTYDPTLTGLDFRTSGAASPGTAGTIGISNSSTGAFSVFSAGACASAALGGCGTIADLLAFVVSSSTLINPTLPVHNFLTAQQTDGGVDYVSSFDLLSFVITQTQPNQNTLGTTTLSGAGVLNFTGFDPTAAIMTVTIQGGGNTSFSGSVVAQGIAVPEPASMLLLGAGVVGLGLVRGRGRDATA